MRKIQFVLTAAVMLLAQALHAQDASPIVVSKTATDNHDGTYTLTLKTHLMGNLYDGSNQSAADIVFLMDVSKDLSGSLSTEKQWAPVSRAVSPVTKTVTETVKAMTATTKDAVTKTVTKFPKTVTKAMTATNRVSTKTQNWTYYNLTANATGTANFSFYYRDDNGDYYVMHKWSGLANSSGTANNVYAIGYIDKNGNTWYLTNNGVSSTYEDITGNKTTLWNGTLYKGWTYTTDGSNCYGLDYGNEYGTAENQWYYLHTDGKYYPVRRANNLPDANGGNNAYAAWVVIDGTTFYLHGERLDSDYDHSLYKNVSGERAYLLSIWFGAPLYKGGWDYSMVTSGATASKGKGYYYHHSDGNYYPVQKAQEPVDGVSTYQMFVEIPENGQTKKYYLYGEELSEDPCPYSLTNKVKCYFGAQLDTAAYTGWCYNRIYDGTTSGSSSGGIKAKNYYLYNGEYYPVRKATMSIDGVTTYQAYIETLEGKRYLNGNGVQDTPYLLSKSQYTILHFGSLYEMSGWSSGAVTAGTTESGHSYRHSDNKYYPVQKVTLGPSTTPSTPATTYQLFVEVPENGQIVTRYLWGHTLHSEPCPYSCTTYAIIWYGSLYKGGWTYNTISEGTHLYLYNGEYYPVRKAKESNVYQSFINTPDGKLYLHGDTVSLEPCTTSLNTKAPFFYGPLYSGGWKYGDIITQTTAGGEFYRYNNKYYRVLREEGTTTSRRLYIEVYENSVTTKYYLVGRGVSATLPSNYYATDNTGIFFGTLYRGGWSYNASGTAITAGASGGQYVLYNNTYFPVRKGTKSVSGNTTYQAWINYTDDSPRVYAATDRGELYLTGSDLLPSPQRYFRNSSSSLYLETLYQEKTYSKAVGLQNAVWAFVQEMVTKSQQTGLSHRIALAQFGIEAWGATGGQSTYDYPHLQTTTSSTAARKAAVLADLYDITSSTDLSSLQNKWTTATVTTATSDTKTAHRYGLSIAQGLFSREGGNDDVDYDGNNTLNITGSDPYEKAKLSGDSHTNYSSRPKYVIIIGDGVERAAAADLETNIQTAKSIATALKSDPNVKIYYVHVGENRTNEVAQFEQALSSGSDYCKNVALYDEGLKDVLLDISQEIGGSVLNLGDDTIVQDVVTPEFTVPTGYNIELYTSHYAQYETGASPRFATEDQWIPFEDGTVTKTVNADGTTTIRVTGFDFSANWCGEHVAGEGYTGEQLIVKIPIVPKEGIVGGIVATNTADSQLLDANENWLADYEIQYVTGIPMHIQISKSGLREGDSAIFTIRRKLRSAANFDVTPFMKVILTGNAEGTAVTADIINLNPEYIYLIEEGDWSWTYTPTVQSISTEDQTTNPFVFGNTARTDINYDTGEAEANNIW